MGEGVRGHGLATEPASLKPYPAGAWQSRRLVRARGGRRDQRAGGANLQHLRQENPVREGYAETSPGSAKGAGAVSQSGAAPLSRRLSTTGNSSAGAPACTSAQAGSPMGRVCTEHWKTADGSGPGILMAPRDSAVRSG